MKHPSTRQQGFTLIEVMVSLGVMMVGTMAVLALQQHTIRSTTHARNLSIAVSIAERWTARLQEDAHNMVPINPTNTNAPQNANEVAARTEYLTGVSSMDNGANLFMSLPATDFATTGVSRSFDHDGNDIITRGTGSENVAFCASYRPSWIWTPAADTGGGVMRVDVRVWWPREGVVCNQSGNAPDIYNDFLTADTCTDNDAGLSPDGAFFDCYHVLYLPGVVRMGEVR